MRFLSLKCISVVLFGLLSLVGIQGCSLLGGAAPTASVVANTYLLRAEFDMAVSTLERVPFNTVERQRVDNALANVSDIVDRYDNVTTEVVVMTVLQTRSVLDEIVDAYTVIETTYEQYLERTGQEKDSFLKAYGTSAIATHDAIDTLLDEKDDAFNVDPTLVAGYVGLILRVVATTAL